MRIFAKLWPGLYLRSAGSCGRLFEQGFSVMSWNVGCRSIKSEMVLQWKAESYSFARSYVHCIRERLKASRK